MAEQYYMAFVVIKVPEQLDLKDWVGYPTRYASREDAMAVAKVLNEASETQLYGVGEKLFPVQGWERPAYNPEHV